MAVTLNDGFLAMIVLSLMSLGVTGFIEKRDPQDQPLGNQFFSLLFIVLAVGLVAYKISNP